MSPGSQPTAIKLTERKKATLEQITRRQTAPQNLVRRANIIMMVAAGMNNQQVFQQRLGLAYRDIVALGVLRYLFLSGHIGPGLMRPGPVHIKISLNPQHQSSLLCLMCYEKWHSEGIVWPNMMV